MRWLIGATVGFVALAALVWWQSPRVARLLRKDVQLARRELPGGAIAFPEGKLLQEDLSYPEGKVLVRVGSARFGLSWNTGEAMTTGELETILIEPLRDALAMSVVERNTVVTGGKSSSRWLMRGSGVDAVVSAWTCGKRWFNLSVTAPSNVNGPAIEQRIRDSFTCSPDPQCDGKPSVIGVEFDLGPDFGMGEENPLTLMSLDHDALVVSVYTGNEPVDHPKFDSFMPRLMDGIATSAGIVGTSFQVATIDRGGHPHKVWRGAGKMSGVPTRMVSTAITCGPRTYLGMYMGQEAYPESRAMDLLFSARCTETPKRPGAFDDVARKACARGDKRGCAALEEE